MKTVWPIAQHGDPSKVIVFKPSHNTFKSSTMKLGFVSTNSPWLGMENGWGSSRLVADSGGLFISLCGVGGADRLPGGAVLSDDELVVSCLFLPPLAWVLSDGDSGGGEWLYARVSVNSPLATASITSSMCLETSSEGTRWALWALLLGGEWWSSSESDFRGCVGMTISDRMKSSDMCSLDSSSSSSSSSSAVSGGWDASASLVRLSLYKEENSQLWLNWTWNKEQTWACKAGFMM